MPGSVIVELILQPLAEGLLHIAGYITGRVVVPAFSLGFVCVEPIAPSRRPRPKWRPSGQGFYHRQGRRIVLSAELGTLLGLVFWLIVGLAAYGAYRYTSG